MKKIAIIAARGGSKRIPKKNIRAFAGEPIIAYSARAAVESGLFDTTMVSTDEKEIAEIAARYGVEAPFFRSAKTADDFATTADVVEEVLQTYQKRGETFDVYCCLYATAPFVTSDRLREAFALLEEKEADAVAPVVRFDFPPQRGLLIDDKGAMRYWFPEHEKTRSQDLAPVYHDCGQFYFGRTEAFLKEKTLFMKRTAPLILTDDEAQDIDTEADWLIAEEKYARLSKRRAIG